MATITQVRQRFEQLDEEQIAEEAVRESADLMADLNAMQINTGLKADGTEMPDYSFRSVFQYGKPPGPIRLRDTGAWQAGLRVQVVGDSVVFDSTDSKDRMLRDRYGDAIQGLSDKYANEAIREAIEPAFMRKIREAVQL